MFFFGLKFDVNCLVWFEFECFEDVYGFYGDDDVCSVVVGFRGGML